MRYLVVARRQYAEALSYQGMLEAAGEQDPGALATARFGAHWLELVLVPEHTVCWVLGPDTTVEVTA